MRTTLMLSLILICGAHVAASEEAYLVDEWTATFSGGVKISWQHEEIVKSEDEATGAARYTRTVREWTPVGKERISDRAVTVTDAKGRVLSYTRSVEGPVGPITVALKGRDYKATVRGLPSVKGTLDSDAYDIGVICSLMRSGALPSGERTVARVKLPGSGLKEVTFAHAKAKDGTWRFIQEERTETRDGQGVFVRAIQSDRPHGTQLPASEENAANRSIRDKSVKPSEALLRVAGASVVLEAPAGPWKLTRDVNPGMSMIGLEHPLHIGLLVLELGSALPEEAAGRLAFAEQLRSSLGNDADAPDLGAPREGKYGERAAIVMDVGGTIAGEPVAGSSYLIRSKRGTPVFVLGAYAKDLAERCAPILATAMKGIHLDAVKPAWTRVSSKAASISLEVPGTWDKDPSQDRWLSAERASQIAIHAGTLPKGMDIPTAQDGWVKGMQTGGAVKDVKVVSTSEVTIDGRVMHKKVVSGKIPQEPGKTALLMQATALGLIASDGTMREVVIVLFSMDSKPEYAAHVEKSIRWTGPK